MNLTCLNSIQSINIDPLPVNFTHDQDQYHHQQTALDKQKTAESLVLMIQTAFLT